MKVAHDSGTCAAAIRVAAPDFLKLQVKPAIALLAQFGLVTLAARRGACVTIVRVLIRRCMRDVDVASAT